jgi:polysaccharide biosynthesis acetyltransferase WcbI-like protein
MAPRKVSDRVVVVGNCQATAIEIMLNTNERFVERFELISFPPVHEIQPELVPRLHEAVESADLVVPQRIEEGYRDGLGLGTETLARLAKTAAVVRWPSVYWAGYFKDLFYLRDGEGQPVVDGPFDYHDRAILRAFAEGRDASATIALLADAERPSTAPEWANAATAELAARGEDCDVDVAPFIEARFREQLLFFTMNHPANALLAFIAQRITELAGIPGRVEAARLPGELLGSTFYPLHANDVRSLELTFGAAWQAGNRTFRIRGVEQTSERAIEAFFAYYSEHSGLVEPNLEAS